MEDTITSAAKRSQNAFQNMIDSLTVPIYSISNLTEKQTLDYDDLKNELNDLRKVIKRKRSDIEEKETKLVRMESIIRDLKNQNNELIGYNKALKETMEMITKVKF